MTLRDQMADECAYLASDRARGAEMQLALPLPGSRECGPLWLATWEAFRHVTTQHGKKIMLARGMRDHDNDTLEAFVHGKAVPAHERWAETEAMIRAGEWRP